MKTLNLKLSATNLDHLKTALEVFKDTRLNPKEEDLLYTLLDTYACNIAGNGTTLVLNFESIRFLINVFDFYNEYLLENKLLANYLSAANITANIKILFYKF